MKMRQYTVDEMDIAFKRFNFLNRGKPKNFWLWIKIKEWPARAMNYRRDNFMVSDEGGRMVDMLLSPHYETLWKVWKINNGN